MTSDMMVVCQEENNWYHGRLNAEVDTKTCFFIDECSMGEPLSEFGRWFNDRFSGFPSMAEQMLDPRSENVNTHNFTLVTDSDCVAVSYALSQMKYHIKLDKTELVNYMTNHRGKHISTENW